MTQSPHEIAGKYRVIRLLGEGGMGQVFEAVNKNTERRVAIKTLHPRLTEDGTIVQRFLREARAATLVRHPNVVDVLDLDVDPVTRAPYLVQEFLVGDSLADALTARPLGRFGVDETLKIMVPVMSALAAAHALGVVHRDLKPDNIFLVRDGDAVVPKLIDFGIAKVLEGQSDSFRMTQTGAVMGTPSYMSPEQAGGLSSIDGRTDVWSIGVVMYELLVGTLPYQAPNYNLLVAKILFEQPTPILEVDPSLRPDVAAVVQRALTTDRDARFPTMQAMLDATLACVSDDATRATYLPSAPAPRVHLPSRAASAPTALPMSSSGPSSQVPTLASWTGKRSPSRARSSAGVIVAVAVGVAALAGSAMWFTRPAPSPSSAAAIHAPISHVLAPPVARPEAVAAAVVDPAPLPAPTPSAPPAAPLAAPPAPAAPAAPAAAAPAALARTTHGRHRHPHGSASHGSQDFDRGYPQ